LHLTFLSYFSPPYACYYLLGIEIINNQQSTTKSHKLNSSILTRKKDPTVMFGLALLFLPTLIEGFIHQYSTAAPFQHQHNRYASTSTSTFILTRTYLSNTNPEKEFKHTLAVLTLPQTSNDRIANEAILETCMKHTTDKLSIVLRCPDNLTPKLNELRGYVGEIYSMAWDVVLNVNSLPDQLLDLVIYPQNLPNAAAEAWITHRPDLECICSHSSIIGWISNVSHGSGRMFENVEGSGIGGLNSHVDAVNVDRRARGLSEVVGLEVENWPDVCLNRAMGQSDDVVFLEDDEDHHEDKKSHDDDNDFDDNSSDAVGHYRIPSSSLYNSVAVGGTWDGVHYGHRKLLTLAISSVVPNAGKLLIGITTDEMLQQKDFANLIPPLKERIQGVRNFVDALAPGMKNRIKIIPIKDAYGPPGSNPDENIYVGIKNDFDALVLSHETLPTGSKLNQHRVQTLGMEPLKLLCTRRTEAHGMSSTALRRIRSQQNN